MIYLDHAATTAVDDRVLAAMMPYFAHDFGNGSSVHAAGRRARHAIEESRERVAAQLGAAAGDVIFTSGGTESDNLAIGGRVTTGSGRLITSKAEHEAVLNPARALAHGGFDVVTLDVEPDGTVQLSALEDAVAEGATLVSLMHVNNETGSVHPLREIGHLCSSRGIALHVDAVQSVSHFKIDVDEMGIDLLSISGHKIYGPKGIGALYVRPTISIVPQMRGGAQERGRRGGTENVAGIVGLATALDMVAAEREEASARIARFRKLLLEGLQSKVSGRFIVNTPEHAAPHILNITALHPDGRPLDGEMLILGLDLEGVCVSSGSACGSGAIEPSHVLLAMGRNRQEAAAAIRFSLGRNTTAQQIDDCVQAVARVMDRMTDVA